MFSDDDLDIDAGLVRAAEDLDDTSPGAASGDWRPGDFDVYDVAVLRINRVPARNAYLVQKPLIDRRDETLGLELYECSDDRLVCVMQHRFNASLTPTLADAGYSSDNLVIVQS